LVVDELDLRGHLWDPKSRNRFVTLADLSPLHDCAAGASGGAALGMTMTIITITTRFRGASG
jgi:hypothetical protein